MLSKLAKRSRAYNDERATLAKHVLSFSGENLTFVSVFLPRSFCVPKAPELKCIRAMAAHAMRGAGGPLMTS
jgi:hypothetical protein